MSAFKSKLVVGRLWFSVVLAACGTAEKSTASNPIVEWHATETVRDDALQCEGNHAPHILDLTINRETFCEDGTAHLIVDAKDPDSDDLEYQFGTNFDDNERDGESPKAAYVFGLHPDRSYRFGVIVGDGCTLNQRTFALEGPMICAHSRWAGIGADFSDNAYVSLLPPITIPL